MATDRILHEAISASAGSGKTFELAHRYIRLLAGGVSSDRIIALTFSRKAAGEIFDSIVGYLCLAASSPDGARETAERLGISTLNRQDFVRLLRGVLDSLHRLRISTLDSFTVGILRAFPMELGVSGAFQVMDADGAQARAARQEVLGHIFSNRGVGRKAQREFLEAFKQATYGQEEKGLQRSLDTFIGEYRELYEALPVSDAWGQPMCIWPEGSPWLEETVDIIAASDELGKLLEAGEFPESVMRRWNAYLDAVRDFGANSPWAKEIEYLSEKLAADLDGLRQGRGSIKIERTVCGLSPRASHLVLNTLNHLIRTELNGSLQKTQGIFRVLHEYERVYDEMVRRQGKLTFADAQSLLTPANPLNGGVMLSRDAGSDARLYIDYRLDCRLDHWLLDEFQDTSDLQWEAISNLVDEVLQDSEGGRSFFYVGDVKQAIYGWRGGNARLFGKILEQYGDRIRQRPLSTSFRSAQPVIDTVNRVFSELSDGLVPSQTAEEWGKAWREHKCQTRLVPQAGHVALLEPPCNGGESKPTEEDRFRIVAGLLREIDPIGRGLSAAILVRSNENGKRLVNFLRRECEGMTIVHEGKAAIKDNPVVSVLLSLVKLAAHPGDTFAWRHIEMSPLRRCLASKKLHRNNLSLALLKDIHQTGFQGFIRGWGARLEAEHPLDDFGRQRLRDLVEAAGEFDAEASRDCNAFLHFIDNHRIHDLASDDAVRIMTIHQSKGLGFDLVIVPDLQGRSMTDTRGSGLVVGRDATTNMPLWSLSMPRKLVAESDPVLSSYLQAKEQEVAFDALCVLYVALTRAKQGLYMVTSFPGKQAAMVDSATFLKQQLVGERKPTEGPITTIGAVPAVCLYETGEREWYLRAPALAESPRVDEDREIPAGFHRQPSSRTRLVRVSPSEQHAQKRRADELFSASYYDTLRFGTVVHQLFRKVAWIEDADTERLVRDWEQESPVDQALKQRVAEHFRRACEADDIRRALSRPGANAELWRERPFEAVLEDRWVSGSFDRVGLTRDGEGWVVAARIQDFKTDEVDEAANLGDVAGRYRSQLLLYQRALSRMLGLDARSVTLELLFTHSGKVHVLDQ